jgi:hypothetical protein
MQQVGGKDWLMMGPLQQYVKPPAVLAELGKLEAAHAVAGWLRLRQCAPL